MRILLPVLILSIIAILFLNNKVPESFSCIKPIHYSIGELDPRFKISKDEFLALISEAEKPWEDEVGKQLFIHDKKGSFKVNLIFDERQEKTELVEATEEELNKKQEGYSEADKKYRGLVEEYESASSIFKTESSAYEKRRKEHEKSVSAWNASPRTNEAELNKLKSEEKELSSTYSTFAKKESELSALYSKLEDALAIRNKLVRDYNSNVNYFNDEFAGAESFDQGDYTRGEINIYQFKDENDLRLVITHELGHALGISHVDDPKSVMYYLMGEQSQNPIVLTTDDVAGFKSRCSLF